MGRTFYTQGKLISDIAKLLSVDTRSVERWTSDVRQKEKEERDQQIWELYLQCYPEDGICRVIADLYPQIALSDRSGINKIIEKKRQLSEIHVSPDSLQTDTIWMFQNNDSRYGMEYPGRISISTAELVFNHENKPVTTSLIVAQAFEKEHRDVLRAIRDLPCPDSFRLRNFTQSSYQNDQKKEQPMYLVTRKGFALLGMGFTGEKATRFKEQFIAAFNQMEIALREGHITPREYGGIPTQKLSGLGMKIMRMMSTTQR